MDNFLNLGKYVIVDIQVLIIVYLGLNCLCCMMVGVKV